MKKKTRNWIIGVIVLVGIILFIFLQTNDKNQNLVSVVTFPDGTLCEDSDDGNDIFKKGYVQLKVDDFVDEKQWDYCVDVNNVAEYSCALDVSLVTFKCAYGCDDGKCVPSGCISNADCEKGKICKNKKCIIDDKDKDNNWFLIIGIIIMVVGIILMIRGRNKK